MGYIDCTVDCPGTEDELKYFQTIMEDVTLKERFPLISSKLTMNDKKNKKSKGDTKEMMDSQQDDMEENPRMLFMASLQSCTNFSQSTLALLSMAAGTGNGMQFGATSDDPDDLTYVAPNAVSNISLIEYDYSEYYEDIVESESSKKRRDASNEV